MKLVVDANVFISALVGGKAAELLFNPNLELLPPSAQHGK
jgi:predicted nucleic acid-binding protein